MTVVLQDHVTVIRAGSVHSDSSDSFCCAKIKTVSLGFWCWFNFCQLTACADADLLKVSEKFDKMIFYSKDESILSLGDKTPAHFVFLLEMQSFWRNVWMLEVPESTVRVVKGQLQSGNRFLSFYFWFKRLSNLSASGLQFWCLVGGECRAEPVETKGTVWMFLSGFVWDIYP